MMSPHEVILRFMLNMGSGGVGMSLTHIPKPYRVTACRLLIGSLDLQAQALNRQAQSLKTLTLET